MPVPRLQIWLAILFGIATVVTTINSNGAPLLQWMISPFYTLLTPEMLQDAAPATILLWFILGAKAAFSEAIAFTSLSLSKLF